MKNPEKYVINDDVFIALKTVLECLTKIQKFYEQNFLNKNKNIELVIDQENSIYDDIDKNRINTSIGLTLTENSINQLNNIL